MIIGKKEKDRSGLIGNDLVCSIVVPQVQQSVIKKRGNNDNYQWQIKACINFASEATLYLRPVCCILPCCALQGRR
jgi:hypothetical protein